MVSLMCCVVLLNMLSIGLYCRNTGRVDDLWEVNLSVFLFIFYETSCLFLWISERKSLIDSNINRNY